MELDKAFENKFWKKVKFRRKGRFKDIFKWAKRNKNNYSILRKKIFQKKSKNKRGLCIILFLTILPFIFCLIYLNIYIKNRKNSLFEYDKISFNTSIEKDKNEEINEAENYMKLVLNHTKLDKDKIYYTSKNPKISIVITVYNGEAFLNTALLSIQNQDLKDIEIVMVDDYSKDNSVNLIKELMKTEPRIVLYQNKENKGMLYTKSKGILLSKGKYIMVMDIDDIYVQRDAFRCLYVEAEKNNLDILGFTITSNKGTMIRPRSTNRDSKRIIYQPELSNLTYSYDSKGNIMNVGESLANIFVKAKLYKKTIKLIDETNLNTYTVYHDDRIIYFLLSRNAYNAKFVDRYFYIVLQTWNKGDKKVKLREDIKKKNVNNKICFSILNYLEILFKNTKNTYEDKKIAFSQIKVWYLYYSCRKNKITREKAKKIFKLYLNCDYISKKDKAKIQEFILNK